MSPSSAPKSAPQKSAGKNDLAIEVVADVVCPWCYLGWARLKKALAARPGVSPEIRWTAYQLNADMPVEGVDYQKYMAAKFDPERMKAAQGNLKTLGAEDGITFNFDKIKKAANTNAAHRLIRWAAQEGKLDAVAEGVMRAYFTEGRFIGDENELIAIGAAAGMDKAALQKRFKAGEDREAVLKESAEAHDSGVNGVPFYRLGKTVTVEGSYPADELASEIDKALQ